MNLFSKSTEEFIAKQSFLAFFLSGSILICVAKYFNSQALASVFAVSVLVVYALILHKYQSYIREDQAGDNLYYMGFLFTLISLAFALYEFGTTEHATDKIIANFAIALSSTLVGLALRVFFNQMRVDPYEVERTSRLQLSDAVQRLNSHLNDSVTTFEQFSNDIKKELREALEDTASQSIKTLQECSAQFVNTTNLANQTISNAASKMDETAEAVVAKIDEELAQYANNAKKLSNLSAQYAETLGDSIERIKDLRSPEDIIIEKIEPALNVISSLTDRIAEKTESEFEQHSVMLKSVESVTGATDLLAKAVHGISDKAELLTTNLDTLNALSIEIRKTQDSFKEFIDTSKTLHSEFITEQAESLANINNSISGYSQIFEKVSAGSKSYSEQIDQFTSELETARQRLVSTLDSFESNSSDFSKKAADSLNEALSATTKVHNSLASMSEHLVNSLK